MFEAHLTLLILNGFIIYYFHFHLLRMPYCEATVLEGVRTFMGHTFGIPHRALRDTKFRGYHIPKVHICVLNEYYFGFNELI